MDFKQILIESMKTKCEEEFGKYLFGEFKEFYGSVKEPDTTLEKHVFNSIIRFVRGDFIGKSKEQSVVNAFKKLAKCKETYKEVLKPTKTKLYRGMTLLLSEVPHNKMIQAGNSYVGKFIYKAESQIQSWSASKGVAMEFSGSEFDYLNKKETIPVIIFHDFKNDSDLLFDFNFLNKVAMEKTAEASYEDEVVRISDKPLSVVLTIDKDIFEESF